jgi:N-dimethylarginine dimethylaminohydrolase
MRAESFTSPNIKETTVTTETLSTIIGDTLQNNAKTGKLLIHACRSGSNRASVKFGKGIETVLDKTTARLKAAQRTKVLHATQRFTRLAEKRVASVSDSAEKALDKFYKSAAQAVERVAARAEKVDNKYALKCVELARNMTLPSVKLARTMSEKIAAGTANISKRAGGGKPVAESVPKSIGAGRPSKARRAKRLSKAH